MTMMVTWLWQGLAIAWITAAAVRVMPRLNAATRHAVWWLALAAVLAIPVAHGFTAIGAGAPSAPDLTPLDAAGALMLPAIPDRVAAGVAAIWVMFAAVGVLRIARSSRAFARLKRASSPFERSRELRLPLWIAARDGSHRRAQLRISDRVAGACALGLGPPVILISPAVAAALGDESLDEIVMHEQAHLDRYDDWSQLLLAIVGSLVGLHPAVRFLARRLALDREAACDDRVVSRTGDVRRYASSLLAVAAASNPAASGTELAGVPAATTTASALRVRVGRLLDPRRDRAARLARATSLVSATALALAVFVSTQAAHAVVFLEVGEIVIPAVAPAAVDRALEPVRSAHVAAAAAALVVVERPARRTPAQVEPPAQFEPPEAAAAVQRFAGTTLDTPVAATLDSRIVASDGKAPLIAVPMPSGHLAPLAVPPGQAAPREAVRNSTVSAAGDVARAAAAIGARARGAGVSIGRFVTRASKGPWSKAGANVF